MCQSDLSHVESGQPRRHRMPQLRGGGVDAQQELQPGPVIGHVDPVGRPLGLPLQHPETVPIQPRHVHRTHQQPLTPVPLHQMPQGLQRALARLRFRQHHEGNPQTGLRLEGQAPVLGPGAADALVAIGEKLLADFARRPDLADLVPFWRARFRRIADWVTERLAEGGPALAALHTEAEGERTLPGPASSRGRSS